MDVPSQSGKGTDRVPIGNPPSCPCEDFTRTSQPCKHAIAARPVCERDHDGKAPELVVHAVPVRPTTERNWPPYNQAQQTGRDRFRELPLDLLRGIPEPPQPRTGRRRVPLPAMPHSSALKVVTTLSPRRLACEREDAREKGVLPHLVSSVSVTDYMEQELMTPYLVQLVERAALPLRMAETTFAADSTGFGTSRVVRGFDEKYGRERSGREWVKAHAMAGAKTNAITTRVSDAPSAGASPQFRPMPDATAANGFRIGDVCADKAYLSHDNLAAVASHGGTPYSPFKVTSPPGEPGTLWERMSGYFQCRRPEFLTHYHQRSNVEGTFRMAKAKFRGDGRSRTGTAMKNEVLLKFLCHNIVVVHPAIIELGIEAEFGPGDKPASTAVLRSPGVG